MFQILTYFSLLSKYTDYYFTLTMTILTLGVVRVVHLAGLEPATL